jgi:hypothetical protein
MTSSMRPRVPGQKHPYHDAEDGDLQPLIQCPRCDRPAASTYNTTVSCAGCCRVNREVIEVMRLCCEKELGCEVVIGETWLDWSAPPSWCRFEVIGKPCVG